MVANTAPIYTKTPDVSTNGTTGMSQAVLLAGAASGICQRAKGSL